MGNDHFAVMSVDLDRDYPIPKHGQIEAVSKVMADTPENPSCTATFAGLEFLLDLFDDYGIKAIFFIEASLLNKLAENKELLDRVKKHDIGNHGLSHEDFTGEHTGIPLVSKQIESILRHAINTTEQFLKRPTGFRAPYLHFNNLVASVVSNLFSFDSSITIKQVKSLKILGFDELAIPELPLTTSRDQNGNPISTYLWQLLEGNRPIDDYLDLYREQSLNPNIPYTVFALHPWHIPYHVGQNRLSETQMRRNKELLRRFVASISSFGTVTDALNL